MGCRKEIEKGPDFTMKLLKKNTLRKSAKMDAVKKRKGTPSKSRAGAIKKKKAQSSKELKEIEASSGLGALVALEPRIMFDGAALATGAEVIQDTTTQDQTAVPGIDGETSAESNSNDSADSDALWTSGLSPAAPSDRKEIVFIDTSVEDYQTLMEGIDLNAEVILLDSTRDGIEQIAEILGDRSDIDAIHIISHGNQGELYLGTGTLSMESMHGEYADELAIINQALSDEADWLIYGCNFGEGEIGWEAASRLAALTGADIAASDDLTGSADLGGNWELEVETGKIETIVAVNAEVQHLWSGILADTTVTFQEGVDGYASTQDTHIEEDTPTTSYGSQTTVEVDLQNSGLGEEQAIIRFDNLFGSGAGQIPLGSTIISATLTLDGADTSQDTATISLHRMLATWSESSTWNSLTGGISTDDVEAASIADAVIPNPEIIETKVLTGLESTVQAWSDGATNHGWMLKSDSADGWFFTSSEDFNIGLRPKLTVEYRTSGGDISTGLTGHWTFDANANDSSGNNYNGTLTNGAAIDTTNNTDQVGVAKLSLDGSNDYVDLSSHFSNFSGLTEGTIAGWVKTTGTDGTIFSISGTAFLDSRASLSIDNSGQLEFFVSNNGTDLLELRSTTTINDGTWHHVAVTVNSSGNALYIDGALASVTYDTGNSSTTSFFDDISGLDSLNIGRTENSGGGLLHFSGLLDDTRVYNQALSVADIAALAAEAPVATNDAATTAVDTAVNVNVIVNDTDLDSETITVLDVGNPINGTVVNNNDGTVTYTPNTSYAGGDSFTYLTADLDDTVSYWRLDGNGTDAVGSNNGTLTGTTTVTGVYGDALSFDEVDDRVVVSDFAINNEFSVSFKLKVDDNTGSLFQYIYSHGDINGFNSLNVFLAEDSHAEAGTLKTVIRDTDDSLDNNALNFDVSHIIGDGQWHTYTLTVAPGEGAKVYLDGILQNTDSARGGDSFNPTTDLYFGAKHDLDASRFYGGSLDSVQVFNRALSAEEVNDTHTGGSSLATVTIGVGDLVVDTTSDVADGDTSSIGALLSDKGADGFISLREAITATNNTPNGATPDEISFSIGTGLQTIVLSGSGLPDIIDPLILDATTQPGYAGDPIIQIDGTSGAGASAGLRLLTNDSTIKGFIVHSSVDEGLEIDGSTGFGDNNTIQNNWVGIDSTGAADPNTEHGILITDGATNNQIGGTGLNEGNVVSGNSLSGIYIRKAGTDNNIVEGNLIGVAPNGSTAVPNTTYGVWIDDTASGNRVGGTTTAAANVIAHNTLDGIAVTGTTTGNAFLGNSIHSNTGLGVDLTDDGLTFNDADDVDTGSNDLLNFPVLTNVVQNGSDLDIDFDVDLPAGNYRIEFFDNASGLDSSGFGEGETFIGFAHITVTGAAGYESFSTTLNSVTASNVLNITTTATEADGTFTTFSSSSEFGPQFLGAGVLEVTTTNDKNDGDTSSIAALLGNRGTDGEISLREAIIATNNTTNGTNPDEIHFNISAALVGGAHTIQVGNVTDGSNGALPNITDAVIIDGTTDSDFSTTPIIELDGTSAGAVDGLTLAVGSNGSTLRGLVINQFGDAGIKLDGSDINTIVGNYIGTDVAGTGGQGNTTYGIEILNSASNLVGGSTAADRNVIADNSLDGITIWGSGSTMNVIQGNYIGVDATGNAGLGNNADGIVIGGSANNNTIGGDRTADEGNVISGQIGATSDGIEIDNAGADNNKIYGNYIGTNFDGTMAIANARHGVVIYNGVQGTFVGGSGTGQGNIISGNTAYGVIIDGNGVTTTSGNLIRGNTIGLEVSGTSALANGSGGIHFFAGAQANTIGGDSGVGEGNVISGHGGNVGIYINGDTTDGNIIRGNRIGTNAAGTAPIANFHGIWNQDADGTIIGGDSTAGLGNVISGNSVHGVYLDDSSTGVLVQGNLIGTNAAGNTPLANLFDGVRIEGGPSGNTIGGDSAGNLGNVIAGNSQVGVHINSGNNNFVYGNWIGTNSSDDNLGNTLQGVYFDFNSSNNLIGSATTGFSNTIAYNSVGVAFNGTATGTGNALLGNSIYSNTGIGIDFNDDAVTANDADDGDTGPNNLLNFPVLTNVVQNGANLDIDFDVDLPAGNYRIEFFDNTSGLDSSGFGEGESFIGFVNITTTGAAGYESFSTTLISVTASNVLNITTTATEADGTFTTFSSTSEFGPQFLGAGVLEVTTTNDKNDGDTSSITALLGNRGADGEISLREAIIATNNTTNIGGNPDQIHFNIAGAGPHTIQVGNVTDGSNGALPDITDAVLIDGWSEPDFTSTPIIRIDGASAGAGVDGLSFAGTGDGSTVRGLMITTFSRDGILVQSGADNITIAGNWIGTTGDWFDGSWER